MAPRWTKNLDLELIKKTAYRHELEPRLVAAVVQIESGGNTYACRYEPNFKWLLDPPGIAKQIYASTQTMIVLQKTSWGLMNIMGAVAYEHGLLNELSLSRRWPSALTNPQMGLNYGCKHLRLKYEKYGPDPRTVYAAYNAGSPIYQKDGTFLNHRAVERFFRYYEELR